MNSTQTAFHWQAENYGKTVKRSIELAKTRGMWADINFAYFYAVKAFHFAGKALHYEQTGEVVR